MSNKPKSPWAVRMPDGSIQGECLKVIAKMAKEHEEFNFDDWEIHNLETDDPTTIEI